MSVALKPRRSHATPSSMELALQLVRESYTQLSAADRKDFYDLFRELKTTRDEEGIAEIFEALRELLDTRPLQVVALSTEYQAPSREIQEWMKVLSSRVKQARQEAKLTQMELAELTGIHQAHLSRIENAQNSPSHKTLAKIAKAVRRKVDYFQP